MRLEGARMDLIKKIWTARKLILVVMIPLSLLPLPLIHPCSVSRSSVISTIARCAFSARFYALLTFGHVHYIVRLNAFYLNVIAFYVVLSRF